MYIGIQTLVKKEVMRVFRIWKQTLLPPVITSSLYFLVFWKFMADKISNINGIEYIDFIVPGLILMAVIYSSYSNVSTSFFWARFQRSIDEVLISPLSNIEIIIGYCLWWTIRWILVWILVLIVSLLFTNLSIFHVWYIIAFLILTATLFSLLWLTNGIFANTFDDVSFIPTFIITPLTYLGWVFYSIDQLSTLWQVISKANPILYMINGLRYGFLWVSDVNVQVSLFILCIFTIIFVWINLRLLRTWFRLKS